MRVKKLFCSLFFLGIATCSLQKANATTNSSINSFAIDQEKFEECLEKMPHPWKGHRAFAEWLVKEIKPSQVVDLGVDYGFSTFIFANAAMKNGQGVVTCFSSRRRHTRSYGDWSSDVCSSDLRN